MCSGLRAGISNTGSGVWDLCHEQLPSRARWDLDLQDSGQEGGERVAEDAHPNKAGSLIDKVWCLPNLRRAWTLVKAHHGTWGRGPAEP